MAFEDDVIAKLDAIAANLNKGLSQIDLLVAEAVGSWQWDKVNGILRLYSTSGQEVAVFTTTDLADKASRERRFDLEVKTS